MIYSSACSCAIRAMSRLALIQRDGYVLLDDLCRGTDLSRPYVAKIFRDLVRSGLLLSAKGRGGGFALAREPGNITLLEIVAAVDGIEWLDHCAVGMAKCDDHQPCPQHDEWMAVRDTLRAFFTDTTLKRMSKTLERKLELLNRSIPKSRGKSKPVRLSSR